MVSTGGDDELLRGDRKVRPGEPFGGGMAQGRRTFIRGQSESGLELFEIGLLEGLLEERGLTVEAGVVEPQVDGGLGSGQPTEYRIGRRYDLEMIRVGLLPLCAAL